MEGGVRMAKLVLASASPRRAEILNRMNVDFEVMPVNVPEHIVRPAWLSRFCPDEKLRDKLYPYIATARCAIQKTRAGCRLRPNEWVMGVDTLVFVDNVPLGKPGNEEEARAMLRKLNGRKHQVVTAMFMRNERLHRQGGYVDLVEVTFDKLTENEIRAYAASGEGWDKAGGYAIQGAAGKFIAGIEGDYWATVGLSMRSARQLFRELGQFYRDGK